MTNDEHTEIQPDALLSRLSLIEERPLAERAEAYGRLHDELSSVPEQSDSEDARR